MSPYVVISWFWQFVYHWQTLIAGAFALVGGAMAYVAGVIQARATRQASEDQIAEARRKDYLQARCIVEAIIPELLLFGIRCDAAEKLIREEIPKTERPEVITDDIVSLIFRAKIEIPPLLSEHLEHLYLLGDEAGSAAAGAISLTLQYNDLVALHGFVWVGPGVLGGWHGRQGQDSQYQARI
jgi:hypothetical protein